MKNGLFEFSAPRSPLLYGNKPIFAAVGRRGASGLSGSFCMGEERLGGGAHDTGYVVGRRHLAAPHYDGVGRRHGHGARG